MPTEREERIVELAKKTGYTGQSGEMAKKIEKGGSVDKTSKSSSKTSGQIGEEYTPAPGESPYEKYYEEKQPSGKTKQEEFVERTEIAQEYAREEYVEALEQRSPEKLGQALELGVQRRAQESKTRLFQQSAVADLMQSGLIEQRKRVTAEGEQIYYGLTPRGQNLGIEKIYELEEGATWGKSFDFILGDDELRMYPQGTRRTLKEKGIDEPTFIERDGGVYLVTSKEGEDLITVQPLDPHAFSLKKEESIKIESMVKLTGYDVTPQTKYKYSLREGELNLEVTGLLEKGAIMKPAQLTAKDLLGPTKVQEGPIVLERVPSWEVKLSESLGKPWEERGVMQTKGYIGSVEWYQTDYTKEWLVEPIRNVEEELSKNVGISLMFPFLGGATGVMAKPFSTTAEFVGGTGERVIKQTVALEQLVEKAGYLSTKTQEDLSPYERWKISSEFIASGEYLVGPMDVQRDPYASDLEKGLSASGPLIDFVLVFGTAGEILSMSKTGATKTYDVVTGKEVTGKTLAYEKAKIIGYEKTGPYIIEKVGRGGQIIAESRIPPGHPMYGDVFAKYQISRIGSAVSPVTSRLGPVIEIGKSGAKTGLTWAGIQTGVEVAVPTAGSYLEYEGPEERRLGYSLGKGFEALGGEGAQTRIVTAGVSGFVVGGAIATYYQAKPFLSAKGQQYKLAIQEYKDLPTTVLGGGADAVIGGIERTKTLWFLAGSERPVLEKLEPDNPIFLEAQVTAKGLNPFEAVKPPSTYIPPPTTGQTMGQERQRYTVKIKSLGSVQAPYIPIVSIPASLSAVSSGTSAKTGGAFAPPKLTPRESLIQEAKLSERGMTQFEMNLEAQAIVEELAIQGKIGQKVNVGQILGERLGIGERPIVGVNVGVITGQRLAQRQLVPERIIVAEIPIVTPVQYVGVNVRQRYAPPVETPRIPVIAIPVIRIGLPSDDRRFMGRPEKLFKERARYAPSLLGIDIGKLERKTERLFTGFEVRGLPSRRKKRKKK